MNVGDNHWVLTAVKPDENRVSYFDSLHRDLTATVTKRITDLVRERREFEAETLGPTPTPDGEVEVVDRSVECPK